MQGYRNIQITLQFSAAATNSNGTEATFFHRFSAWTGSESVDKLMPISVWIPEGDAGSTVLISQAKPGELYTIDGDLDMGDIKDEAGNYHPYIRIRAHNIYAHSAHKYVNKVTLFGKVPYVKLFELRDSSVIPCDPSLYLVTI